jgi:hypothetical protein
VAAVGVQMLFFLTTLSIIIRDFQKVNTDLFPNLLSRE